MSLAAAYMFGRSQENLVIPIGDFVSYWQFENNLIDSIGSNNGSGSNITYENGLVGRRGLFNGVSTEVNIADSNTLTFSDGITDKPFSISLIASFNTTTESSSLFTKYQATPSEVYEYGLMLFGNNLDFTLFGQNNVNIRLTIAHVFSRVIGENYLITVTYDGSGSELGLNMYINDQPISTTRSSIGSYSSMFNTQSLCRIGYREFPGRNYHDGTYDQVAVFKREITLQEHLNIYDRYQNGESLI